MTQILLLGTLIILASPLVSRGETAEVSWATDEKTGSYRNVQTKIEFPRRVAGFTKGTAFPAHDDGSASFGYDGDGGVITLYLRHRGISGCAREGDCVPRFLAGYREELKQMHGTWDTESSVSLSGRCGGRAVRGGGTTYHFPHLLKNGPSVYSELGAVQVGDFLFYYRGSFPNKKGLANLSAFLRAIGLRKV